MSDNQMAGNQEVAVVGTGIMGGAIASRLVSNQFSVRAWNRNPEKASVTGARVASAPAEAVAGADVVITMLSDGNVTETMMRDAVGSMEPGAIWLQMATIGIEATERLVDMAASTKVAYLDAPVLGTKQPAEQGQLVVFASGSEDAYERCRPIFDVIAVKELWLGEAGGGTRLKLVVNAWLAALIAGLAEAIALAEGIGVDPADFLAAIEGGPVGPAYAQVKGKMMIERSYPTAFPLHLLTKDVDLVSRAAERAGVDLRLPDSIRSLIRAASGEHGDEDMSALVEGLRSDPV